MLSWSNVVFLWMCLGADHLMLENQLESATLGKMDPPSLSSHQLPIVLHLGLGPCVRSSMVGAFLSSPLSCWLKLCLPFLFQEWWLLDFQTFLSCWKHSPTWRRLLLSAGIHFYHFSASIDQLAFYIYSTVKGINFLICPSVSFLTWVLFGQCVRFMAIKDTHGFVPQIGSI